MKNIYIILACFTLSILACKNDGGHNEKVTSDTTAIVIDTMKLDSINPGMKRFEMEKGIMNMLMFSSDQILQKRTIYFDRFGARLVIVDERGLYIYQMNGFEYHINPRDKHIVKEQLRYENHYDPLMLNAMLMSDEVKKEINWTADGEEEILGHKCQKYKCHELKLNFTTEVWLYKGFPLLVKNQDPAKNVTIIECKKMQENVAVNPAKFVIPKLDK